MKYLMKTNTEIFSRMRLPSSIHTRTFNNRPKKQSKKPGGLFAVRWAALRLPLFFVFFIFLGLLACRGDDSGGGTGPTGPMGSTPTLTISASTATVLENGGVIAFTVVASPAPSEDITVNLTRSGTATQGDDYSLSGLAGTDPNYTLTVGTSGNALIRGTAQADSVTDDNETIVFTLAEGEGYMLGANTMASVSIDDVPPGTVTPTTPSVTISASEMTVSENGVLVTFTVVASPAPSGDLTVNLTRSGTATPVDDYSQSAEL